MPALKTYDLFISHAWKYGDSYDRIVGMLDSAPYFYYRNYSAPSEKPLQTLDGADVSKSIDIQLAIDRKIRPVNCVLVLSGMYVAYRNWMQYELDEAGRLGKPIVAIRPWGSVSIPTAVSSVADEIVGWNTDSIVRAIRQHSI